jgi:hypothetical protein
MCQKINHHRPLQGYLFSEAKKLIGVEINSWFHNVQVDTVAKYKMKDRIEVSDRLEEKDIEGRGFGMEHVFTSAL